MVTQCKICGMTTATGAVCRECLMHKHEAYKRGYLSGKRNFKADPYKEELRIAKIKETWRRKNEGIIIQPEEPFLSHKCSTCEKNQATELHECPYA